MFVAGVVLGLFAGAGVGVLALSVAAVSGRADERAEVLRAEFGTDAGAHRVDGALLAHDDPRLAS